MFKVETNKYSHEGSSATRIDSRHESLDEACEAAAQLLPFQRWVYVAGEGGLYHWWNGKRSEQGLSLTEINKL